MISERSFFRLAAFSAALLIEKNPHSGIILLINYFVLIKAIQIISG